MRCPYCGSENNRVVDSRPFEVDNSIRRRRICENCEKRFTTFEKVESVPLMVVKKDNTREQYDRTKIENGILRSCNKRPVSVSDITRMVDEIEKELFGREEREVESAEIGELVMEKLKEIDQVSYVRFASVYREFKDANTFMDELKKLLQ